MILKGQKFADIIKDSETLTRDSIITFGIKPEYEVVVTYVDEGYYWNAGIFMFNTEIFICEVKHHAQNIYNAFESSDNIKEAFGKIDEKISIDSVQHDENR